MTKKAPFNFEQFEAFQEETNLRRGEILTQLPDPEQRFTEALNKVTSALVALKSPFILMVNQPMMDLDGNLFWTPVQYNNIMEMCGLEDKLGEELEAALQQNSFVTAMIFRSLGYSLAIQKLKDPAKADQQSFSTLINTILSVAYGLNALTREEYDKHKAALNDYIQEKVIKPFKSDEQSE
jgi:hypothetical protein